MRRTALASALGALALAAGLAGCQARPYANQTVTALVTSIDGLAVTAEVIDDAGMAGADAAGENGTTPPEPPTGETGTAPAAPQDGATGTADSTAERPTPPTTGEEIVFNVSAEQAEQLQVGDVVLVTFGDGTTVENLEIQNGFNAIPAMGTGPAVNAQTEE